MKAILAVNMRDPGCGALGSVFYCHSVSQSLLGWPTFIVKALPTSSHLFRSLPEGNRLPKRLSNLGSSTCSTRLVPPPPRLRLPSGSIRSIVRWTSQSRWSPGCVLQTVECVLFKKHNLGDNMTNDISICSGWQLHIVHYDRSRQVPGHT